VKGLSRSLLLVILLGFVTAFVLGAISSVVYVAWCDDTSPIYALTKEVTVSDQPGAPYPCVRGTLLPGTQFRINHRKADVNYVELDTILLDKVLRGNAKPLVGFGEPPWEVPVAATRP
jgi:hypothetical protein